VPPPHAPDTTLPPAAAAARQAVAGNTVRRRRTATAAEAAQKARPSDLLHFKHLPPHLADNEFVRGGYRRPMALLPALRSAFSLHNETANVWTHLIGALAFLGALVFALAGGHGVGSGGWLPGAADSAAAALARAAQAVHLPHLHHGHVAAAATGAAAAPAAPVWPIGVFLASAVVCLGSSAAFHLLHVVDVRTFELLARFDYVGIAVLIAGSVFPPYVYGFWCEQRLMWLYLGTICALCLACCALGMLDAFRSREWRWWRTGAFLAAGLGNVLPLAQLLLDQEAMAHEEVRAVARGLLLMGALYVGGAMLYGFRVPERFAPGRMDAFNSHAIWHLFVVSAAAVHYSAVITHRSWRGRFLECGEGGAAA
jgi:adiponectin receptor